MYKFITRVIRRIGWQIYLIKVSDLSGKMIRKFYRNIIPMNGLIFDVSNPGITNRTAATIFHKAYEKNELLFISKYLNTSLPTIEFGSSIGVTGSFIGKLSAEKIYCVEANPELITTIERQFELNKLDRHVIYNAAVSTSKNPVYLKRPGSSDTSLLVTETDGTEMIIESTSLRDILDNEHIAEFNLVCDIEGSEVDFLTNEPDSLNNCRLLIIELHQTVFNDKRYQIGDIEEIIRNLGFKLLERKEEVFAFSK